MRHLLFSLFFGLSELVSFAQKPIIQWQKSYGGSYYDKAESVIETTDGGYVIAGQSQSSNGDLTINRGGFDSWVIKINKSGQIQWKQSLGGSATEYLQQVVQAPDGSFLCIGQTNSTDGDIPNFYGHTDYWVIKLNSSGLLQWKKSYGGSSNDWGYSACITNDNAFIIAGYSESNDQTVLGNHGSTDFWILKINMDGNILWQKSYGGTGTDHLSAIIPTSDGGFAMTGYADSKNGDFVQNLGSFDIWVVKINSIGNIQWKNNFGGTLNDFGRTIIEDSDGNFVISGETYSEDFDAIERHNEYETCDFIVIKTNSLGQKIWSKCFGGEGNEYGRSIVQTFDSEYAITGETYSNTSGQPTGNHGSADYWLIKINPVNGDLIWEKTIGGDGHDEANCLTVTFDNGYLVVGNSASNNITDNHGDDDFWVVKLKNIECQKNLNLITDIPLGNIEFKALENITSHSKILNNTSNILYSTGKSIILNPGFKTTNGAIFEAKIAGCN